MDNQTVEPELKREKLSKKSKDELEMPKRWQNFFVRMDSLGDNIHEWTSLDLLAYFGKKYKEHFNRSYAFDTKKSPSYCSDGFLIKKLVGMLQTTNQHKIKDYIDWVFANKVKKILSFGYFANNKFCNEYLDLIEKKNKITRTTVLPSEYLNVINLLNLPVSTFGDLMFAKQAVDANPIGRALYVNMFNELYKVGFEFEMLSGLK